MKYRERGKNQIGGGGGEVKAYADETVEGYRVSHAGVIQKIEESRGEVNGHEKRNWHRFIGGEKE